MTQVAAQKATDMLYHVGCGTPLFTREHANNMALACRCGANSPIVTDDLNDTEQETPDTLPASLFQILNGRPRARDLPHVEYYLGFSQFECPAKTTWVARLRDLGMVSFDECDQERCLGERARFMQRMEMWEPA